MADATLQRLVLKGLMRLPRPVLRGLAGGGVVYVGGRTLDPAFQFLAAQGRRTPPLESLSPQDARAATTAMVALMGGPLERGVRTAAVEIPGPAGMVPARAYRPADQDPNAPVVVFAHFGGGVIGGLDTCEAFCSMIAARARCAVVSVDYRLAPEHRFPAGLDDVLAAFRWVREHADDFGAPSGQAAIGGDSMGGNFAAVVCQDLKAAGEPQPAFQLLVYPATDVASETASMTTYAHAFPLSRATMDWFMGHYMGPGDSPANPRLSPLRAADLSGLAPAIVVTAGFDPLSDQGEAYARRLKEAGVKTVFRCFDPLAHGFTAFTGAVPAARDACLAIADLVRTAAEGDKT
ncbi:MAG TPA: alpha/beta hydrolase [Caulobacteraceae bacterium]|nr:alpha/beta hydrolase [Caulobacteraceae bacterium]